MRKDKKLGRLIIPGCGGGRLTDAYRLLAEVYQLLNEYAPVWYREDLQYRLQATLRPPDRALGPRTEEVPAPGRSAMPKPAL